MDFGYDNQDAVTNVNMEVDPGDYLRIVGKDGSDKSTLTEGLLGLTESAGGKLATTEELKGASIGYLPQQAIAWRDFPVIVSEMVLSGCLNRRGMLSFYSKKEKEITDRSMEKLGITPPREQCYRELSGRQQQWALITRALCAISSLLILDEPITGLDSTAIQGFYAMIRGLSREDKVAILMVSHDLRNAVEEANRIFRLQKRVLFYGPAHDYMNSQAVGRFFHKEEQGRREPTAGYHAVKLHMHREEKSWI